MDDSADRLTSHLPGCSLITSATARALSSSRSSSSRVRKRCGLPANSMARLSTSLATPGACQFPQMPFDKNSHVNAQGLLPQPDCSSWASSRGGDGSERPRWVRRLPRRPRPPPLRCSHARACRCQTSSRIALRLCAIVPGCARQAGRRKSGRRLTRRQTWFAVSFHLPQRFRSSTRGRSPTWGYRRCRWDQWDRRSDTPGSRLPGHWPPHQGPAAARAVR